MGVLIYSGSTRAVIDDRVLGHLQVVIVTKLRRNEAFAFTWITADGDAPRRRTVWLHPGVALEFQFDSVDLPELNRAWISDLAATATGSGGLVIVPEPASSRSRVADPPESLLYTPQRGMAQVWGVRRRG